MFNNDFNIAQPVAVPETLQNLITIQFGKEKTENCVIEFRKVDQNT